MASSIQEFGFKVPVLARSSGEVIDGHLRLKAAQKLSITEIPVILCDDWTESQVKAFRLLVNRSVTWAEWDPELLSLEMLDLRNLDYDLDLSGFDTREIDELLLASSEDSYEDNAPAAPENPASIAGAEITQDEDVETSNEDSETRNAINGHPWTRAAF